MVSSGVHGRPGEAGLLDSLTVVVDTSTNPDEGTPSA